ncbi:MAG TPA: ATP-binding protein [Arenicellales bacterium]|nr:ATP-binding protein [Arenicellales bacterium]
MRTPGITAKLFLTILSVALVVVVLMTLATQLAFRSDFLDYLAERERERVETLAEVLVDYYRAEGDWRGLEDPARWRGVLREAAWRHRHEDDDDEDDDDDRKERDDRHDTDSHGRRTWRGDDNGGLSARASPAAPLGPTLLDPDGRRIAGAPVRSDDTRIEPIRVKDRTVGRLAYRTTGLLSDRLAREFQQQQLHAAWITALIIVLLAAVVSVLLARGFLAPVRGLAASTRALAAGRFDTRVELSRRDELGRLAADFNRLAETLQRNERLRSEFMADMSHELRTPMAVLRAELEAMEDGVRPLNRESLARLQNTLATLSKLIDDLYELSLADAGALNYRMAPLDLADVVRETAEHWRTRLEEAGLTLTMSLPDSPVTVSGDERRLRQLLNNVLENSLRYTDAGGEVGIALGTDGGQAIVTVEDSAPGVPPEAIDRLFERLYRVEGSRSRDSGGAGLGLAICRNIARAHGGGIEAYHASLGGLGLRLTLPLSD